jgi:hypothetical protein
MGLEKSTTSSTSGSESSTSSDSESDDSEAERVRKLALLQEQVRLAAVSHAGIVEITFYFVAACSRLTTFRPGW